MYCAVTSRGVPDCTPDGSALRPAPLALDEDGGPALVLGWLSQRRQFGLITFDSRLRYVKMHASMGGSCAVPAGLRGGPGGDDGGGGGVVGAGMSTDWSYAQIVPPHCYDEEPMAHYHRAVAAHNGARPERSPLPPTGWCSWYHYYENIDAATLKENFRALSSLRDRVGADVALIDDGYMKAWGDWSSLKRKGFPGDPDSVMRGIADDIRSNGMTPGLWLAPYACDKRSRLARDRPDWIVRNDLGRPANSSNCGKFFYGLDATNPAVRRHAYEAVRRAVRDWGFEVLKLDFLYACCLAGNGRYDMSLTRAEAMDLALRAVRDAAGPGTFLIGCGCPLGTAVGYVDGMRISADTGPTWYPSFPLPWWDESTLPCLRAMIRNTATRSGLGHRWWHNDPDCLLLGETTDLTDAEVVSAATVIAMTGGMVLLSDDLTKLRPGRLAVLTRVCPVTGASAVALDLHDCRGRGGIPSLLRLWCADLWSEGAGTGPRPRPRHAGSDALGAAEGWSDDGGGEPPSPPSRGEVARAAAAAAASPRGDDRREGRGDGRQGDPPPPSARTSLADRLASPRREDRTGGAAGTSRRRRSCVRVARGLGTWTVLSLSNWGDEAAVVSAPVSALLPPPPAVEGAVAAARVASAASGGGGGGRRRDEHGDGGGGDGDGGYHVFAFWSSKYISIPPGRFDEQRTLSKRLGPHETEIFHVKPVWLDRAQYVGSDLHFTCGYEVRSFSSTERSVDLRLKNDRRRSGFVFLFLPGGGDEDEEEEEDGDMGDDRISVTVNGEPGRAEVVARTPLFHDGISMVYAGRVVRVPVVVNAIDSEYDGRVAVRF